MRPAAAAAVAGQVDGDGIHARGEALHLSVPQQRRLAGAVDEDERRP
jgi:hypothetical protein